MSSPPQPAGTAAEPTPDYVKIVGHSNLFYWWPVWALGFLMALLTFLDGHRMAVVPAGPAAASGEARRADALRSPRPAGPGLYVANTNNYGVIFVGALLFVTVVSNITLRGLVSVIFIILLVAAGLGLALLGWWDAILAFLGGLDIRMNMGGYLAISVPLFLAWLFVVFVYDRQHYIIFDQGQIRIVRDIGDGETVMDVHGIVVEKKRDDVFRHWVLGLGSGDLKVRPGGQSRQETFEIENVLNIAGKLRLINQMLQERKVSAVVAAPLPSA